MFLLARFLQPGTDRDGGISTLMQIWPAIDLRDGHCVRLQQGDYDRETTYSDDPVQVARGWQQQGAAYLHLVDLDGARTGSPDNLAVIARIMQAVDMTCEVGGGIRSRDTIRALLDLGVHRLVIGTKAVTKPEWFRAMCGRFPGQLVLGLDARDGRLATDGWRRTTARLAADLVAEFQSEPLAGIIYTDIATDGMLSGPNLEAVGRLAGGDRTARDCLRRCHHHR